MDSLYVTRKEGATGLEDYVEKCTKREERDQLRHLIIEISKIPQVQTEDVWFGFRAYQSF